MLNSRSLFFFLIFLAAAFQTTQCDHLSRPIFCSTPYPGDEGQAAEWSVGQETYYLLLEPQATDCPGKVPFGITRFRFRLHAAGECSTEVVLQIYDTESKSCPRPDILLYSGSAIPVAAEEASGPVEVAVPLDDTICVYREFCLAVSFPHGGGGFQPYLDRDSGSCRSFVRQHGQDEFIDVAALGFSGQFWMQAFGLDSTMSGCSPPDVDSGHTAVESVDLNLPTRFALQQNYPNPFNPSTTITYSLTRTAFVKLTVRNLTGQTVRVLVDGTLPLGVHRYDWDGCDSNGNRMPSGVYFCHLQVGGRAESRKMLMLR
jgi:hypothetical protein